MDIRQGVKDYLSADGVGWTTLTQLEKDLDHDYNDIQQCLESLQEEGKVSFDWLPSLFYPSMLVKNWYWVKE